MLLNSHISAYARCLAGKVCGLVRSTWATSQGEDKPGARDEIFNTKVARWACTGQTFPLGLWGPSPVTSCTQPPYLWFSGVVKPCTWGLHFSNTEAT